MRVPCGDTQHLLLRADRTGAQVGALCRAMRDAQGQPCATFKTCSKSNLPVFTQISYSLDARVPPVPPVVHKCVGEERLRRVARNAGLL